ncbi:MAG: LysM peptidoglycan-binding domain-containing protein [Anaerolineae bacterium]|nr:LysM peptidoglycan-binding domain-containing protein [Anaerolineae bacterium]MDW8072155.1 LysM peptidoglycan-binding domain-containing protein [Anaerolineae bacterium]
MDFQELLERYKQLRADFDAGKISEEEFQEEIEGLQIRDEQGYYWTIGAQSGKWYRYNGVEWVQETPLPMTKHQGRGIPEAISRWSGVREDTSSGWVPRWLYTGCAGFLLLVVLALLIVLLANILQSGGVRVSRAPTPTLALALPAATPTPAPTPSATPTPEPTPTSLTLQTYSNSVFGFTLQYPSGWQAKETERYVVLAPDEEGLSSLLGDQLALRSAAFVIQVEGGGVVDTPSSVLNRIVASLPIDPSSSETGTRAVSGVEWAISQVKLTPTENVGDMTAYVAATVYNNAAYTVVAAAPSSAWSREAPTFQKIFDSIRFTAPQARATAATETPSSALAFESVIPSPTATRTPTLAQTLALEAQTPIATATPTPVIHVVQSGDTLLAIAAQYGVSVQDLQAVNGIVDPTRLQIGQQLIIPVGGYAPSGGAVASVGTPIARAATLTIATATPTQVAAGTVVSSEASAEARLPTPTATQAPRPTPKRVEPVLSGKIAYPVFVPDRKLQGQMGSYDLYIKDLQGGEPQLMAYNASQPCLNLGGDLLAYKSWDSTGRGLAFLTIGGGRSGLLTNYIEDGLPYWEPSSITLVFTSRREGDRVPRMFRVNQTNNQETGLGLIAEYASVFPDGRIVYKGCTVEGACGLFLASAEGVGATRITDNTSDTAPAPSPDGSKIAFMSLTREGAGNYEIYIMNSDGQNVMRLTNNSANDGLPTWSPDGGTIAFVSDRDGSWGIWAMNPDGSNQRKLFTMQGSPDGIVGAELLSSRGWLEERISWSR